MSYLSLFFFFNDTATTEIYTLSLHDALPISIMIAAPVGCMTSSRRKGARMRAARPETYSVAASARPRDRKSTRLNSSHLVISYAVFCLKKKKKKQKGIVEEIIRLSNYNTQN